ncbi:MAG: hypothetical protein [Bacteriophage sp.]|nr:MAG: hypothetical protein [Bacteriophage sp.]
MSKEKETVVSKAVVANNAVEATEATVTKATNEATKVAEDAPAAELLPLSAYWGKDADTVTDLMLGRSDVTNHANCIITNVVDRDSDNGFMTIVVSKGLPQFVLNADTGAYEMSTTRNIFTSRIQIAAILKGMNETVLAKIVETAPFMVVVSVLEGARISVMSRLLAAGEQYINPYASKAPSEVRVTEHDRIEYFPYELKLGNKFTALEKIQLAMMFK